MSQKLTREKLGFSLRAIRKYLRPHTNDLVVISLLGIVSAITNGSIPVITGRLFDSILAPEHINVFSYQVPLFITIPFG